MIDNLEFVKFVLANRTMNEEEKNRFLAAAPKMTQDERAEYILKVMTLQVAGLTKEVESKEAEATAAGKNPDEVIDAFLQTRGEEKDQDQIDEIRDQLKQEPEAPSE